MKSQKQNEGELKELKVSIEKEVVESFEKMADRSGIPIGDLVVIALKRFKVSHGDYTGQAPEMD